MNYDSISCVFLSWAIPQLENPVSRQSDSCGTNVHPLHYEARFLASVSNVLSDVSYVLRPMSYPLSAMSMSYVLSVLSYALCAMSDVMCYVRCFPTSNRVSLHLSLNPIIARTTQCRSKSAQTVGRSRTLAPPILRQGRRESRRMTKARRRFRNPH